MSSENNNEANVSYFYKQEGKNFYLENISSPPLALKRVFPQMGFSEKE